MKITTIFFALCCACTTGCVALYKPPSHAALAKIRLTTDTDDNTAVFVYDSAGCESALAFIGPQARSHDESDLPKIVVGESPQPSKRTRERVIEAGKRIEIHALSEQWAPDIGGYRCVVGVRFVPRENSHYELDYRRNASARNCTLHLRELYALSSGEVARNDEQTATYFKPAQTKCTNR